MMSLNPLNLLAGAAGLILKPFSKKAPKPAPVVPAIQRRQNGEAASALERRRGSRGNQRTGPRGAEAPSGGKTKLGQ